MCIRYPKSQVNRKQSHFALHSHFAFESLHCTRRFVKADVISTESRKVRTERRECQIKANIAVSGRGRLTSLATAFSASFSACFLAFSLSSQVRPLVSKLQSSVCQR